MHVAKGDRTSVGRKLEKLEVRVDSSLGEGAMPARAAGGGLGAEQELGERHSGSKFADVRRAREQVGVAELSLLEASLNEVDDPAMPDDVWWAGD